MPSVNFDENIISDVLVRLSVEYDCKIIQVEGYNFQLPVGLKVYAHYGNGNKYDVTNECELKIYDYVSSNVPLPNNRIPGQYVAWQDNYRNVYFDFSYEGVKSERFENIVIKMLDIFGADTFGASVTSEVPALNVKEHDRFNLNSYNFVISLIRNGVSIIGNLGKDYINYKLNQSGVDSPIPSEFNLSHNLASINGYIYVSSYEVIDFAAIQQINVEQLQYSHITIKSAPNKTDYYYGEKFDSAGVVVEIHYFGSEYTEEASDNLTFLVSANNEDLELVSGVSEITEDLTVKVIYNNEDYGENPTFSIRFQQTDIVNIRAYNYNNSPVAGDAFNPNNIRFDVTYADGRVIEGLSNSDSTINISGVVEAYVDTASSETTLLWNSTSGLIENQSVGKKYLAMRVLDAIKTVSEGSPTYAKYNVPVYLQTGNPIKKMSVERDASFEKDPFKYYVGEKFNARGLIVVVDDNNIKTEYGAYKTNPELNTTFTKTGKQKILFYIGESSNQIAASIEVDILPVYSSDLSNTKNYKIDFSIDSLRTFREDGSIDIIRFGETFKEITNVNQKTIDLGRVYCQVNNNFVLATEYVDGVHYYVKYAEKRPLFEESKIAVDEETGRNKYIGSNASSDCIGYIDFGFIDEFGNALNSSRVVFFSNIPNPTDNDSNITVLFPYYTEGYSERISKCHNGIIYNNRLFVTGNEQFKNVDWHTSPEGDLTYFSDLDYCEYGTEGTAVVGYDIYKDGTLIVFKTDSRSEATIYTRQSTLVNASSYDGAAVNGINGDYLKEEAYPCFPVNINGGVGAVNSNAIVNYLGETVFATTDDIKILGSKETTFNNAKYTVDTSVEIKNVIKNEQLESSFMFQYKNDLYLITKDSLYIKQQIRRGEEIKYAWYYQEGIKPSVMFDVNNELYYADAKGNVYRQNKNTKTDYDRTYLNIGNATINGNGNDLDANNQGQDTITVNRAYANGVNEGDLFNVQPHTISEQLSDEMFIDLGTFTGNDDDETFSFDADEIDYSGLIVYLDNIVSNETDLQVNRPYRIMRVDENKYVLQELITFATVRIVFATWFRVCHPIDSKDELVVVDKEDASFKLSFKGKIANFVFYNTSQQSDYQGYYSVITHKKPISAYWITKPFDLKDFTRYKTIFSWSVINDSNIASKVIIGYLASRNSSQKVVINSGSRQIDLTGWLYSKTQIGSDKLPKVYSKVRTMPAITFIRFRFENEPGENMVLTKLAIFYNIGQIIKGVR